MAKRTTRRTNIVNASAGRPVDTCKSFMVGSDENHSTIVIIRSAHDKCTTFGRLFDRRTERTASNASSEIQLAGAFLRVICLRWSCLSINLEANLRPIFIVTFSDWRNHQLSISLMFYIFFVQSRRHLDVKRRAKRPLSTTH